MKESVTRKDIQPLRHIGTVIKARQTGTLADRHTRRQTHSQTDNLAERHTRRQTHTQNDRLLDRQTHRDRLSDTDKGTETEA